MRVKEKYKVTGALIEIENIERNTNLGRGKGDYTLTFFKSLLILLT